MLITLPTRTGVKGGAVGPGLGHRVEGITVLQALLTTGVRSSHNIELVVQGADTWKQGGACETSESVEAESSEPGAADALIHGSGPTCVAAVGPQLWHLGPVISQRVIRLTTAQLV